MANAILNFHFDYWHTSLRMKGEFVNAYHFDQIISNTHCAQVVISLANHRQLMRRLLTSLRLHVAGQLHPHEDEARDKAHCHGSKPDKLEIKFRHEIQKYQSICKK